MVAADWSSYLTTFHDDRPGITERVLARCRDGELDPYGWCAEPLAGTTGAVLDVGCGSAPMHDHVLRWVGCDLSSGELDAAASRRRGPLVRASASALPLASSSFAGGAASMSLQLIDLPSTLAEMARVLAPGAVVSVLVPSSGPLPWRELAWYGRLQWNLRQAIRYPNDTLLQDDRLRALAEGEGFAVVSDERRPFRYLLATAADAATFLHSLYLPGVDSDRLARAERLVQRRVGSSLVVPLRRVVLQRRR